MECYPNDRRILRKGDMVLIINTTIDAGKLSKQPVSQEILRIMKLIRPYWLPENIHAKIFPRGIHSRLYGYYEKGKFSEDVILFRIEGEENDILVDKIRERIVLQALNEAGCCPPLYAIFNNGKAYGYVHGETLDYDTIRDEKVKKLIAEEICRVHAVRPAQQTFDPHSWKKLCYFMLEMIPDGFGNYPEENLRYMGLMYARHKLKDELDRLWDHVEALKSPIVLCHNDLLAENIIYDKEKGMAEPAFLLGHIKVEEWKEYQLGKATGRYNLPEHRRFTIARNK